MHGQFNVHGENEVMEPTMLEGIFCIVATMIMVTWPFHWPVAGLIVTVLLWIAALANLALAAQWNMVGATVLFTAAMMIASSASGTCSIVWRCQLICGSIYRKKTDKMIIYLLACFVCFLIPYLLIQLYTEG
jgi:hypothetical protein